MCDRPELVTTAAMARMLGYSQSSLLRQHALGRIPAYRVSSKRLRWNPSQVLAALAEEVPP